MQGGDLSTDIQNDVSDYSVAHPSPNSRPRSGRQCVGALLDSSGGGSGYLDSSDSSLSPDLVDRHLEPAAGSLSARCNAPKLALPPRSGEDSLRDPGVQRSINCHADKPPPRSRLPRFTRQSHTDSPAVNASRAVQEVKPSTGRAVAVPGLDRSLSMPTARCPQSAADAKPPTRLGSSFGKGPSTSRVRAQEPQARYSHSKSSCTYLSNSSHVGMAPPLTSRAPSALTVAQPKRSSNSQKPLFKSQPHPSTTAAHRKSRGACQPHAAESRPRPPTLQPPVSPQPSRQDSDLFHSQQQALCTVKTPDTPNRSVQRSDSAHSSTQEGVVLPLGDEELDKDVDEELRGMSFLSTAGQAVSSASSQRARRRVHEFSMSPSPMSSTPSYRPVLHSSPPVRLPGRTDSTGAYNAKQPSAVRAIDFAAHSAYGSDALQRSIAKLDASKTQHSPQSAMRSTTPGMTPATYLGGVSLLDCDDFGFSSLGLEDSTQSISNDGFSTWVDSLKSQTPAAGRNIPPVPVLALRNTTPSPVVLAAAEPTDADANVSLRMHTSGAAHVYGCEMFPEESSNTSLSAASSSTPLARASQPSVPSSDLVDTSSTMTDLRDTPAVKTQDLLNSRTCRGAAAAATPSQCPSLQRALSTGLNGSVDDDCASNALHLTPALVEECTALVRALATVHCEGPMPEDSAMESSLTAAASDVTIATPLPDTAVAEYRPSSLFQGDSPNGLIEGSAGAACATGMALPAIAEGSVPEGATACAAAIENSSGIQQLHSDSSSNAPAAHLATDQQHYDSASEAWLSPDSVVQNTTQRADRAPVEDCSAVATPDSVHGEQQAAAAQGRLQSPDSFQDAVESLATPSTCGRSDVATSPWCNEAVSVATQLPADTSPAQQVFTSASEGSLKQQKHVAVQEQVVVGPSQVWDSVPDSNTFTTPCAQSLALNTDADRLSVRDDSPMTRRARDTTMEDELQMQQPARVCSHVLDSFGTIDSAAAESPQCDTEAVCVDVHSALHKNQALSIHRHEGSDMEPSIPLLVAEYGSCDQSIDPPQTTLNRDTADNVHAMSTMKYDALYESEEVDLEGFRVMKGESAKKHPPHVPHVSSEQVQ